MSVERNKRHTIVSWIFVVVLVVLCATLGALQYGWIGEVSRAEQEKLRGNLQSNLQRVSDDFGAEVGAISFAFGSDFSPSDDTEWDGELASRLARWRTASRHAGLIRRVALVIPKKGALAVQNFDLEAGTLTAMEWPSTWTSMRDRLTARAFGNPSTMRPDFNSSAANGPLLLDLPQFGGREDRNRRGPPEPRRESAWTIVELDPDYIRASLLPELLLRHLGNGGKLDYRVQVTARNDPSTVLYDSDPGNQTRAAFHADASAGLPDPSAFSGFQRQGPGPDRGRAQKGRGPGNRKGSSFDGGRGPGRGFGPFGGDRGRWLLAAQHHAGSLEALVEQSRRRSLAITGGILLLMLVAVGALVEFNRRSQKLAELQMEFVASVSHELRTPLAVIRTAAHNLGARLVSNASQVQRYGALIEDQSEKLTDIVDRVLLFSNAKAGRVIHSQEIIGADLLIDDALSASAKAVQESGCTVEKNIDPDLPQIYGDPTALKHAVLNLITNAAKYGAPGGWIGISAGLSTKEGTIEIRVSDRGPGIPRAEQNHIFDPFYRGKVAVADQIHGTGLGLSLVKRIVNAHGGTVEVNSEPGKLTEFIVKIPAAPAERLNEFANTVNRG